jgi:acyl dehydratase
MGPSLSLERLLSERVERQGEVAVSSGDVLRWSEAHRETSPRHWPDRTEHWVAPPAMSTTFLRPMEWRPERPGPPTHRGSSLHERLKAELGFPLGIAAGYELEMHRLLRDGDRVEAVERIASVGEPEQTRLGAGRRWVVENRCTLVASGELVAVERFSMLGYDPAATPLPAAGDPSSLTGSRGPVMPDDASHSARLEAGTPADRVEELDVTALAIVMGAAANRVWVAAHIDRDAAQAAGVPDLFVDTATQVGLLAGVATRAAGPDARPGRASLRMRRPLCPGDHLRMEARIVDEAVDDVGVWWVTVDVQGLVGDAVHSTLAARVAVAGPARTDPWGVGPDRWRP